MSFTEQDEFWMRKALKLADIAEAAGEVPVAALLVKDNELIAEAHNEPITLQDPTAHAEITVLRKAARRLENYRLIDTTLYVTLEPCLMCAGAIVHARVTRLFYGALDAKRGAVQSAACMLDQPFLNHQVLHRGGLLAYEASQRLSRFFKGKRKCGHDNPG